MICQTNKKIYFSKKCADKSMERILDRHKKSKSQRRFKPAYSYQCDVCGFWHLTSGKKKNVKNNRKRT